MRSYTKWLCFFIADVFTSIFSQAPVIPIEDTYGGDRLYFRRDLEWPSECKSYHLTWHVCPCRKSWHTISSILLLSYRTHRERSTFMLAGTRKELCHYRSIMAFCYSTFWSIWLPERNFTLVCLLITSLTKQFKDVGFLYIHNECYL